MGQLQPGEQLHAPSKDKHGFDEREWNALIGIITALVGNVLISFALNLQRYAHIRLNRDKLRRQKSWASGQRATNSRYGTSVVQPAGDDRIDESTPLHPLSSNMEDEEEEQNKSYLKSPYWWAGILLMTIGEAGNFLAYVYFQWVRGLGANITADMASPPLRSSPLSESSHLYRTALLRHVF